MKLLRKMLDGVRPVFEKDGKLGIFRPIYEAMDNFLFSPSTRTLTAPHVRDPLDVKRLMSMVIVALVPSMLAAFYFFGWRMVAMILVSYMAGGVVEVAFAMIRKEDICEGFLVTGMIFPLILPPTLPLWMLALGVAFGVFVGKELFGGTGRNIFNAAIVGRCFLALAYPAKMSSSWMIPGSGTTGRMLEYVGPSSLDAISQATPLVLAKQGQLTELSHMFLGNISGSLAETSALAIIIGGVFLLFTRVSNWRTVVSILGSAGLLAAILYHNDSARFAPAVWHLCAGGLLFGAFFMATDPVTSPTSNGGKIAYGIVIGVTTILIRNFTSFVEGVTFAILLGNIVAPIFDEIAFKARLERLKNEG